MIYDYIIIDSKLLAFTTFHRKQGILKMLPLVTRAFKFNNIDYEKSKIVWALDVQKSNYRLSLWKDYKGHRLELQTRASKAEQIRRDKFTNEYLGLPKIFNLVGVNGIESVEADDMVSIVRHLRPNANILMISLDLDWLLNVDSKTHLLFFSTNTIYKTKEQVEDKIGIAPNLYTHQVALGGQGKDNILNLQQFGKSRFKKHLVDENNQLREDYGEIIDELLEQKKYGMTVNPKAKFKDWRTNYHLNLQLMNPIPISEVNINELKDFDNRLDSELPESTYEDFMLACYKQYNDIPEISFDEYTKLRKV